MSYRESVPIAATEDLSASQYHAIQIGGTLATAAVNAIGILQNKPTSGQDATACYMGRSRYRAGGAVTGGNRLSITTSGWFTAAGSNELGVGTALGTVSSGGIGEGIFMFAGAKTEVVSAHLA